MLISTSDIGAVGSGSGKGSGGIFGSGIGNVLGSAISGLFGYLSANKINRDNLEAQQDYNEKVFDRADTQYQRTVADLRAAGLSSQLAAGSPSTVAGNTSAPQRDVSAESEAMVRLIDMVNAVKRTNADVNLVNAQADEAKSKTALNEAQLPWVDKLNDSSYVKAMAEKNYTIAMTRLRQMEGDNYIRKVNSEIELAFSEVNRNNKLVELYDKQIALTEAEEGKTQAERKEINQRIENYKQELINLKQDFTNKVKEGLRLDASTSLLVQQAANAWLDYQIGEYNLLYSQGAGLRTSDNPSSPLGLNVSQAGNVISSLTTGLFDRISGFTSGMYERISSLFK